MIYEDNYRKLRRLIDPLPEPGESARLTAPGFMGLHVETHQRKPDRSLHVSLSHYYEAGGDLVADPDMELRVYPEREMVEALTYQDTYLYRQVYPEPGKVDPAAKQELNTFLGQWLSNLLEQGHALEGSET